MDDNPVHHEDVPSREDPLLQDVQDELQKTARPPESVSSPSPRFGWSGVALYVALGLAFGTAALAVRSAPLALPERLSLRLAQILSAASLILLLMALHRAGLILICSHIRSKVSRYNLERMLRLATMLLVAASIVSVFFANWYTTAVSLGLVSLILGLALQAPITSFFAWIYILVRKPYRVGDRVRIAGATGDVIEVGYFDTTLWEFGGELLSTDHPSGRIIKFPNSQVFSAVVYNYSWSLFPYVWNEIKFQVAYESDLEFVARTMREGRRGASRDRHGRARQDVPRAARGNGRGPHPGPGPAERPVPRQRDGVARRHRPLSGRPAPRGLGEDRADPQDARAPQRGARARAVPEIQCALTRLTARR
jgi:small-conductance mechanosensitive channel